MGNANTHERRKSGVTDTGPYIEDIRSQPDSEGEERQRKGR